MSSSEPTAETLAREILEANDDIAPLLADVIKNIALLRTCGLPDAKIRKTIPGMYRLKQQAAEDGVLKPPRREEIRVISLPTRFQRNDWS